MPVELAGVRVNDLGQPILPADDPAARKQFFKLFLDTPTGRKFAPYATAQAIARIEEVIKRTLGDDQEITVEQLGSIVERLLAVRDPAVIPPEPEPVVVIIDDRPRDAQGRFLSEFEVWSSEPSRSMIEIRKRAQQDQAFGNWFHQQVHDQTIQRGALTIAGSPIREATQADHRVLGEFVRLYKTVPSASLKPLGGFIKLGNDRYTPQQFEVLISQAADAGLL